MSEIEITSDDKYAELEDKYLRILAEFDNYKKRVSKERGELIKIGAEDVIKNFLTILDDLECALSISEDEGITLICSKFKNILTKKGVTEIEAFGKDFNTDYHEAVNTITVEFGNEKGKVVNVLQKGYLLEDKVIRFAKVIVGE